MIPSRWSICYCLVALASPSSCRSSVDTLFTVSTDAATRAGMTPVPAGVVVGNEAGVLSLISPGGKVLWSVRYAREITTRPVVVGDKVLAVTASGEWVCVSLADGQESWHAAGPSSATPLATDGTRVFAVLAKGGIRAIDAATGAVAWSRPGPRELRGSGERRTYGAPVVVGDLLVAPLAEAGVLAVRTSNGQLAWRQGPVGASGIAWNGGDLYAVGGQDVFALGRDGAKKWDRRLDSPIVGAPALLLGMLIAPTTRTVVGMRPSDSRLLWIARIPAPASGVAEVEGAVLVTTTTLEGRLFAFAPPATEPFASLQFDTPLRFPPLVLKDRVLVLGSDGRLFGLGVAPPRRE